MALGHGGSLDGVINGNQKLPTLYKPKGCWYYCFKIPAWAHPKERHFTTHEIMFDKAQKVMVDYLNKKHFELYRKKFVDGTTGSSNAGGS